MSRLPRSSFMNKARDSVYPTSATEAGTVSRKSMARSAAEGPEPENALLAECVSNLMRCNISLDTAGIALSSARDAQRIAHVLEIEQACQIVSERTVRAYTSDLSDEIEGQMHELIAHAASGLAELARLEKALSARVETVTRSRAPSRSASAKPEARRLQMLRNQREREERELAELQALVDSLELEELERRK